MLYLQKHQFDHIMKKISGIEEQLKFILTSGVANALTSPNRLLMSSKASAATNFNFNMSETTSGSCFLYDIIRRCDSLIHYFSPFYISCV